MTRYSYNGPVSSMKLESGEVRRLFPGAELDLPEGDYRVKVLVSRRLLKPLDTPPLSFESGAPDQATLEASSRPSPRAQRGRGPRPQAEEPETDTPKTESESQ